MASEIKTSSGCISPTESQGKSWQSSRLSSDELITSTQRPGGGKEERSSSISREHISMAANIHERHRTECIHPVARGHQLSAPQKASVKERGESLTYFPLPETWVLPSVQSVQSPSVSRKLAPGACPHFLTVICGRRLHLLYIKAFACARLNDYPFLMCYDKDGWILNLLALLQDHF